MTPIVANQSAEHNIEHNDKELIFSGKLNESASISEADLYLHENGYLTTEFVVDSEEDEEVVLSPGFEIVEPHLPKWLDDSRRTNLQAYFTYTGSLGPVNVPEDTREDEIAAHITEFGKEACFGVMFAKYDCINLDGRENKFYEQIKSSSNVDFEENESHLVANFEYEGNPYLTLRDDSGVLTQAEREGRHVKIPHTKVKGEVCAYVYGVEISCKDIGQKRMEILTEPVGQRNDGVKVYSISNPLEVKLNGFENPESYELNIVYDEKGEHVVPKEFRNPSPRVDYEIEGTTIDLSEKIKAVSQNLDGEIYTIYLELGNVDTKEFYVTTDEAKEPDDGDEPDLGNVSVSFDSTNFDDEYLFGQGVEGSLSIVVENLDDKEYILQVDGADLDLRREFNDGRSLEKIEITPNRTGTVKAVLKQDGAAVDEANIRVKEVDPVEAEYGEKVRVEIGGSEIVLQDQKEEIVVPPRGKPFTVEGKYRTSSSFPEPEGLELYKVSGQDYLQRSMLVEERDLNLNRGPYPDGYYFMLCDWSESTEGNYAEFAIWNESDSDVLRNICESNQPEISPNNEEDEEDDPSSVSLNVEGGKLGDEITAEFSVTEEVADTGYKVKVKGPENFNSDFSSLENTYSFTPSEAGDYTVSLVPQSSGPADAITGFFESLLGDGGSLESREITVTAEDQSAWESVCNQDSVEDRINCVENNIIPNYFEEGGELPDNPNINVPESYCEFLYGLGYSSEERNCVTG
jgi:hypothetical protein